MRAIAILGCVMLGGCALLDAFGDDGSSNGGPEPLPDGSPPIDEDASTRNLCLDTFSVGPIDDMGVSLADLNTCGSITPDIDFGMCLPDDTAAHPGLVIELDVLNSQEYVICLMSAQPHRFAVEGSTCSDVFFGDCIESVGGGGDCLQLQLDVGPATIYWESLASNGCSTVNLDIFAAML